MLLSPRPTRTLLHSTALLTGALLVLSACGSTDSSGSTDAAGSDGDAPYAFEAGQAGDFTPAALIVDATSTPEGFIHTPPEGAGAPGLSELLNDPAGGPVTEPPQCAGLVVDGTTFLEWMARPVETGAISNYSRADNEDEGIFIMVTTDPVDPGAYPADLGECATFTRTNDSGLGHMVKTFQVTPVDLQAGGAEIITTAQVTATATSLDGEDANAGVVGETLNIITATVRGVTFTVAAPDTVPAEMVSALATAQAQRIITA